MRVEIRHLGHSGSELASFWQASKASAPTTGNGGDAGPCTMFMIYNKKGPAAIKNLRQGMAATRGPQARAYVKNNRIFGPYSTAKDKILFQ
jgi:hypothetical protein